MCPFMLRKGKCRAIVLNRSGLFWEKACHAFLRNMRSVPAVANSHQRLQFTLIELIDQVVKMIGGRVFRLAAARLGHADCRAPS